jgi:hypothetical protein
MLTDAECRNAVCPPDVALACFFSKKQTLSGRANNRNRKLFAKERDHSLEASHQPLAADRP